MAAGPGSAPPRLGRRLAVSALTLLTLGALVELGFRLFVPPLRTPPLRYDFPNRLGLEARSTESLFRTSPTRFWELAPGAREPFGEDAINALGLRGPEPAEGPVFRIAVLGDSCTYGVTVDYPHTYGARLEARLRELHPDRAIEVIDGGVPGYTLYQGVQLFEELLVPLQPDVVVLYHGVWNDFGPALGKNDLERGAGERPTTALELAYDSLGWLRAVQWLGDRYAGTLRHRSWRAAVDAWLAGDPPDGYRVPLADFEALFDGLLERCAKLGTRAIVVLPALDVTRPEGHELCYGRQDEYRDAMRAAAERRGLVIVDLRELFPEELHPELFVDRVHPGTLGHLWLGLELARAIEAADVLASAPPLPPAAGAVRPLRLAERALDPALGGMVHAEVELGPEHAGETVRVMAARAPVPDPAGPWPAGAPPLAAGPTTERLTPPGSYTAVLDADGRAELTIGVPAGLPELAGRRALGFALARLAPAGPAWSGEAWLPLER